MVEGQGHACEGEGEGEDHCVLQEEMRGNEGIGAISGHYHIVDALEDTIASCICSCSKSYLLYRPFLLSYLRSKVLYSTPAEEAWTYLVRSITSSQTAMATLIMNPVIDTSVPRADPHFRTARSA